jgi:hypothetical protein
MGLTWESHVDAGNSLPFVPIEKRRRRRRFWPVTSDDVIRQGQRATPLAPDQMTETRIPAAMLATMLTDDELRAVIAGVR